MSGAPDSGKGDEQQRTRFMWIYSLAAATALAQYAVTPGTFLFGLFLLWASIFLLRRQKKTAQGTVFESHAKWIGRTLYIGCVYLLPAAALVMFFFIFKYAHLTDLQRDIARNIVTGSIVTPADIERMVRNYFHQYGALISRIAYLSITPPILWWLWRCWTGFRHAAKSEPMNKPMAFL